MKRKNGQCCGNCRSINHDCVVGMYVSECILTGERTNLSNWCEAWESAAWTRVLTPSILAAQAEEARR